MFRAAVNPFDQLVQDATAETLTAEPWDQILALADKVAGDSTGVSARQVIESVSKRLCHRNANVQLFSLSLADSLSSNVGLAIHREIASRSFTDLLKRTAEDRSNNQQVRDKALKLVKQWANEYKSNPDLGLMTETFDYLREKGLFRAIDL